MVNDSNIVVTSLMTYIRSEESDTLLKEVKHILLLCFHKTGCMKLYWFVRKIGHSNTYRHFLTCYRKQRLRNEQVKIPRERHLSSLVEEGAHKHSLNIAKL